MSTKIEWSLNKERGEFLAASAVILAKTWDQHGIMWFYSIFEESYIWFAVTDRFLTFDFENPSLHPLYILMWKLRGGKKKKL